MNIDFFDLYNKLFEFKSNIQVSYLTSLETKKLKNFPIKEKRKKEDFTPKEIDQIIQADGICLVIMLNMSQVFHREEYHYPNIEEVLNNFNIQYKEIQCGNKKMAAIMSGLGQYGKNQLVYNPVFGFEHNVRLFLIFNHITNLPLRNKPKYTYMDMCANCNECIKNCPAHALHGDDYPGWLDEDDCRQFFLYGNHEYIPSTKYGINAFLNNKFSEEELDKVVDSQSFVDLFGFENLEKSYIEDNKRFDLEIDYCKECMNQLPCRKTKFIYDKNYCKLHQIINLR